METKKHKNENWVKVAITIQHNKTEQYNEMNEKWEINVEFSKPQRKKKLKN